MASDGGLRIEVGRERESRRLLTGCSQARGEFGVLGGVQACLDDREDPGQVATQQSSGVEPQAGKNRALQGAVRVGEELFVSSHLSA